MATSYTFHKGPDTAGGHIPSLCVHPTNVGWAGLGGDIFGPHTTTTAGGALGGDGWQARLGGTTNNGQIYMRAQAFSLKTPGLMYCGIGTLTSSVGGGRFASVSINDWRFTTISTAWGFGTTLGGTRPGDFHPRAAGNLISVDFDGANEYVYFLSGTKLIRYNAQTNAFTTLNDFGATLVPSGAWASLGFDPANSVLYPVTYASSAGASWDLTSHIWSVQAQSGKSLRTATGPTDLTISQITTAPTVINEINYFGGALYAAAGSDTNSAVYKLTNTGTTWGSIGSLSAGTGSVTSSLDGTSSTNIYVGLAYAGSQATPAGQGIAHWNGTSWSWIVGSAAVSDAEWGTTEKGITNRTFWLNARNGSPGEAGYDVEMLRIQHNPATGKDIVYSVGQNPFVSVDSGATWRPAGLGMNGGECYTGLNLSNTTSGTVNWGNYDFGTVQSTDHMATVTSRPSTTQGATVPTVENHPTGWSLAFANGAWDLTTPTGSIANDYFRAAMCDPRAWTVDQTNNYVYIVQFTGATLYGFPSTSQALQAPVLSQPTITGSTVVSSWTAASGGTSPYTYQVSFDGGAFRNPSSGANGLTDTTTLAVGSHTLTVRVTDSTATTALSNQAAFTISSPLVAPTISSPLSGATVKLASVVSTWTAATGGTSPYTYQIAYDSGAFQAANGTGGLFDTKTLTNGSHTIQVRATDSTNATATTSAISFTVSALTAGAITAPTSGQTVSTTTVTSTWNTATGGTAPYTYKIQYDSAAFRSPSSSAPTPVIPLDTTRYLGIEANPRNSRTDTQEQAYVNSQISPKTYQIIRRYHGWDRDLIDGYEAGITAPQIISPYWYITNANNTYTTYLNIISGSQDAVIDRNAAAVKAYGLPMFLTWQMEPENDTGTAGSAANFILAYQRVVNRFRAAGVTNVSWVWVLMESTYQAGTQDQWYPGDSYVDWIGVDGYNWFDQGGHSAPWKSFQTIFTPFLTYLATKGKPGFIGETATVPDAATPGRKATWYDDMVTTLATAAWSPVKALSYFNSQPFNTSPMWWLDDDPTGVSPDPTDVTHWKAATGSTMWTVASSGLTDTTTLTLGTHTVRIQVTDSVGTVVTTPTTTFNVGSLVAPTITAPVNGATLTSTSVNTTWTAASGGTSPYVYTIAYDGGTFGATIGLSNSKVFANGSHSVQVKATDASTTVALSSVINFTVAATITVPVITAPPVPVTTATFVTSWTAATSSAGGVTYQISYNNGVSFATPSSGPSGLSDSHTFTDGTYLVQVKATDANSLTATSSTVTYQVSSTSPPIPTIDSGPTVSSGGTTSSTTAIFGFHETGNVNPVTFTGQITGRSAATVTSPVTYSGLAAGTYTFTLTAKDTFTNLVSSAATWTWTVSPVSLPAIPTITSGPSLGGASANQTVTITNTGTANLTIGTLTISGANASQFVSSADNASGKTVTPGSSVTIVLTFQPASPGTFTATLNIPNNANTLDTLLLTGSAAPTGTTSASITPSIINYGSILFGTTSGSHTISAQNTGTLPLTFDQIILTSAFTFNIVSDGISLQTLLPNGFVSLVITYTPGSGGEVATGDVAISYSSTSSTGNVGHVTLQGSGKTASAAVGLSSTSLNFPDTNTGVLSSALTITVTNVGTANLVMGTAGISGTNASNFAKTSDNVSGRTITPGTNRTIGITFTPSAVGARSATLNFTDNAIDSPQRVALAGNGTTAVPVVSFSPTSLSFGSVAMYNTSSPQTLTITNAGTSNLVVSNVTLTGANPLQFAIQTDNASGQTITPGDNRTVAVVFKPRRVGSLSATISVTDNAGGSPQAIPLGGTGGVASVQPLAKTVYAYYYPNYGLSPAEGFGSETYQGWGGTFPAPAGTAVTHTFAPPTSIASDYYPADYWSGATGYPPTLYSSSDPIALKAQCVAAITAGVNVLIVSWKPPPDRSDTLIPALLAAALAATAQTGIPLFLSFMIEPYASCDFIDPTDATHVTGGRGVSNVWRAINYINSTYGAHSNFYRTARVGWNYAGRVLGANLFFVNHPEYDYLTGGSPHASIAAGGTDWQTTTDSVHDPALVPLGGLILAESSYAPNYVDAHHFDGGFSYLSLPLTQTGAFNQSVFQFSRTYELGFPPTAICVPGVAPGYSGWRTQDTLDRRFPRNNGLFYDNQWNQALNGVAFDDIAITSWNDWQHGTQIEPATNQTSGTGL